MFVVVLKCGGVIAGVFGPFASEDDAARYANPRNETQKGEMVGIVQKLLEVLPDPRDATAPATIPLAKPPEPRTS